MGACTGEDGASLRVCRAARAGDGLAKAAWHTAAAGRIVANDRFSDRFDAFGVCSVEQGRPISVVWRARDETDET